LADLNSSVGNESFDSGGPDGGDRVAVPIDGARNEVRVRSEWESRAVVQVIDRSSWTLDRVQLERPTRTPNEGKAWAVALQLPEAAGPIPAELRTPQALPRLRRRTPQRPDRSRKREDSTRFAGLRWSRHNRAATMIEAARRHGHFDPRWHTNGLSPRAVKTTAPR
jgi:hypothetical protein